MMSRLVSKTDTKSTMVSKSAKNSVSSWPELRPVERQFLESTLRWPERHSHPADDDKQRDDECRDLDGRPNTDANRQLHLALQRHPHARNVFRRVRNDWDYWMKTSASTVWR